MIFEADMRLKANWGTYRTLVRCSLLLKTIVPEKLEKTWLPFWYNPNSQEDDQGHKRHFTLW